jgi:GAF domain-containing protein
MAMEPIVESLDVLTRSWASTDTDLLEHLRCAAEHVVEAVPECVGMTIARFDRDLTFTVVATTESLRLLDATQYLAGGPCEFAAWEGAEVDLPDVLDEDRWPIFARAGAEVGVKSSLSLPLRHGRQLLGSVNLYGCTPDTFRGRDRELPVMFGAVVELLLRCAEPLTRTRRSTGHETGPPDDLDRAITVLAGSEELLEADARARLLTAAERAGVDSATLARLVLQQASNS